MSAVMSSVTCRRRRARDGRYSRRIEIIVVPGANKHADAERLARHHDLLAPASVRAAAARSTAGAVRRRTWRVRRISMSSSIPAPAPVDTCSTSSHTPRGHQPDATKQNSHSITDTTHIYFINDRPRATLLRRRVRHVVDDGEAGRRSWSARGVPSSSVRATNIVDDRRGRHVRRGAEQLRFAARHPDGGAGDSACAAAAISVSRAGPQAACPRSPKSAPSCLGVRHRLRTRHQLWNARCCSRPGAGGKYGCRRASRDRGSA